MKVISDLRRLQLQKTTIGHNPETVEPPPVLKDYFRAICLNVILPLSPIFEEMFSPKFYMHPLSPLSYLHVYPIVSYYISLPYQCQLHSKSTKFLIFNILNFLIIAKVIYGMKETYSFPDLFEHRTPTLL